MSIGKGPPKPGPPSAEDPTVASPELDATVGISGEQAAAAAILPPALRDGELVAGRYRIIRYVARGGMGEVYEAQDQELGERIALKTMRGESQDRNAEERFKREIQLSRKVTHPNVCRIFDVGYHVRDDGLRVVFFTMEFLPGKTLLDRMREEGPLSVREVADVLRQVAAGVGAAHAVGVVHRDLKSSNVMLVPRSNGAIRAVVTDFGLAHDDIQRSLSGVGLILGTPAYMAPEQVEGSSLSPRTDVYSLGIVLYELLTGRLPFEGATPMSIATKRLTTPAPSPKLLRPDLPPRWEKAILACLERNSASRPASPRAVVEMIGLVHDSLGDFDATTRLPLLAGRGRKRAAFALLVAGIVAASSYLLFRSGRGPAVRPGARRAIAALPFHPADDATGDEMWIGGFAAELVSLRLGEGRGLQVFDTAAVVSSLRDIGVTEGAELAPSEVDRLRALLTLDQLITGRYRTGSDGQLIVEAELRDAVTRRTVAQVKDHGPQAEVAAVLGRVADRLARAAGVRSSEAGRGLGMTLPRQPSALRAFIQARDRFDRREIGEAAELASAGVLEEPEHARLHLLLGEIKAEAGDDRAAQTEAKAAAGLAEKLPRLERIFVESAAGALLHDREKAIRGFEQLRAELPNDMEIGWRTVEQLDLAGRSSEALRVIAQLRQGSVPAVLDALLDTYEVDARVALGDLDRALVTARRAAAAADRMGARQLHASAGYRECSVLELQRRLDEARAACQDARRTAAEAGNRRLRAYAVNRIADIDFKVGRLDDARRGYEDILPVFRELGDRSGEAVVLSNLGNIQFAQLDRDGAAKLWLSSVAIADEFRDARGSAPTRDNLAGYYAEQLDWARALSYAQDAKRVWHGADEPNNLAEATCRLAALYLEVGRGKDAERQLDELQAIEKRLGATPPPLPDCAFLRADVEMGRGHPDRAVSLLRALVGHVRNVHDDARPEADYLLARALAETGERTEALKTLAALDERVRMKRDAPILRQAQLLRLRLELERGGAERAAARLAALEAELKQEHGRRTALVTSLELERARARSGERASAQRKLKALSESAVRGGLVSLGLEAQLIEAELRVEGGAAVSKAEAADYRQRADVAGRPGWADRMDGLAKPRR